MALKMQRASSRHHIANILAVVGCVMLALAPWISIDWLLVVVWFAVAAGLIGLSHLFAPFSNRVAQLHATPMVDPSHRAEVESASGKEGNQSAI